MIFRWVEHKGSYWIKRISQFFLDFLFSSPMTSSTANNQSNVLINETAIYDYMRQFVDYQENGVDLNELSQIRQLDIYLQSNLLENLLDYATE